MFHMTVWLTSIRFGALGLILLAMLAACSSDAPSATPQPTLAQTSAETDRYALEALYNATDGPKWTNNKSWLSDERIGEWHGVTTDYDGRVTGLGLDENQLNGEIPPELGNLASLRALSLRFNQLSREMPLELANLANLEWLDLQVNQLSGEIPSELGNLANLRSLALHENQLSGAIPLELGNLANLALLALYNNQLSGAIPPELGNLANLTHLYLANNQLSGCIPSSLQDRLDMDFSDLGGIPFC